jgi:NAD(P)-dependent dehydrogenase (short-subunit alcohol dehydrogenase family)
MNHEAILVTGGAKRVGRAVVEHFANKGFKVIFTYNDSLKEAQDLQDKFPSSVGIRVNLSDETSIGNLWSKLPFNVSVLINSASLFIPDALPVVCDMHIFNKQMTVNVAAPILMTQHFIKQSGSVVVNFLDKWACTMPSNFLSYSLSKMALKDFTAHLHRNHPTILRVYGLLLGFIMHNPKFPEAFFEQNSSLYPSSIEGLLEVMDLIITSDSIDKSVDGIIDLTAWK